MVRERTRVFARIRPWSKRELEAADEVQTAVRAATWSNEERTTVVCVNVATEMKERRYRFDRVFDDTSTQAEVFSVVAAPVIEAVLKGCNGTVLAYGQTGTGKTHTMLGHDLFALALECTEAPTDDGGKRGLIPRAMSSIFGALSLSGCNPIARASYVEVYQSRVFDLLGCGEHALEVRDDPTRGVALIGAEEVPVSTEREVLELLWHGARRRATAATDLNERSSRSHTIFSVCLQDGVKLTMVDLAGSEKWRSYELKSMSAKRIKELTCINCSLSALAKCVTALADGRSHVPYRDSKLTHLLRDSIGAQCAFVTTISPSSFAVEETLSTLDFARRAMKVKAFDNDESCRADAGHSAHLTLSNLRKELAQARNRIECLERELAQVRLHNARGTTPADRCRQALRAAPPIPDDVPAALRERLAIVEESIIAHADEVAAATRTERDALRRERDKAHRACASFKSQLKEAQDELEQARHQAARQTPRVRASVPETRRRTSSRQIKSHTSPSPSDFVRSNFAAAGFNAHEVTPNNAVRQPSATKPSRSKAVLTKPPVTRHLDIATGVYYYHDRRTKITSWDPPADWDPDHNVLRNTSL